MSPSYEDLERLLRNATPAPRSGFVEELERSLGLARRRRGPRRQVAAAGVACAIAVAAVVIRIRCRTGVAPGAVSRWR